MEGLAIILFGMLTFFLTILVYSREAYVQILTSYLAYLNVLLMSFIAWKYAEVNIVYVSSVLKSFFMILVFVFIMFNFYLIFKLLGWLYRLVVERFIR